MVILNKAFAEYDKEVSMPRHRDNLKALGDLKTGQESMSLSIATIVARTNTFDKDTVIEAAKWICGIIFAFLSVLGAMWVGHTLGWHS